MVTESNHVHQRTNNNDIDQFTGFTPETRSAAICAGVCRVPSLQLIFAAETIWPPQHISQNVHKDTDLISVVALHTLSGGGTMEFIVDGKVKNIAITSPSVIFYNHRELNKLSSSKVYWRARWYEFEPSEDIQHWLYRPIPVPPTDADGSAFASIRRNLSSDHLNDHPFAAAHFTSLIYRWLRDSDIDLSSVDQQIVYEAATAFRNGVRQGVTVEKVSKQIGIHASSLRRLFQIQLRMSPKQYLDRLRCGEAKNMLRRGTLIKQIASSLGFENQSQFSRFFKCRTGLSPSVYQNRYYTK